MAKVKPLRQLIYGQFDSEAAFARSLGWNRQKLNRITNGDVLPSVKDVVELANGLGTTVDSIVRIFLP